MKKLAKLDNLRGRALAALALILVSGLAAAAALVTPAPLPAPTGEGAPVSGEFATAIVVDAETGDILFARDPHSRHEPASIL